MINYLYNAVTFSYFAFMLVTGTRVNYFPFAFSLFQGFVHWLLIDLLYLIFLTKWILFCIFYFYKIQLSCVKLCKCKIYQDFTFPIHIWQQKISCRAIWPLSMLFSIDSFHQQCLLWIEWLLTVCIWFSDHP